MTQFIRVAIAALLLVAGVCLQSASAADGQHTCVPGQKVNIHNANRGSAIQYDVVIVEETSDALAWMGVKDSQGKILPVGDRTIPMYNALRAVETGKDKDHNMQRYMGGGTVTFTAYHADVVPDRIYYLSRFDICLGSVPTRKFYHEGVLAYSFQLPIADGGAHPLFDRRVLQNRTDGVLLCITPSVPTHAAFLTAGPARGQPNTHCSLPGSYPGTTRISQASRDPTRTWVMGVYVRQTR